jgi:putative transposase
VFALQQAEACRKLGISEATFYSWKKKYSGLGPVELRRLRQLEEENAQLKRIVADAGQTDAAGRVKKKVLKVRQRRQLVSLLLAEYRVSERRAVRPFFFTAGSIVTWTSRATIARCGNA